GACAASWRAFEPSEPRSTERLLWSGHGRHGIQQTADARIGGRRDRGWRSARDERALLDHAEPRAECERLAHVVRNDDDGFLQAILDSMKFCVQLGARDRVERAK